MSFREGRPGRTGGWAMVMAGQMRPFGRGGVRRWPEQSTPHSLFVLDKKRTGRTRKGYAASVSGKAANGCAVDGPREKIAGRRTCTFVQVCLNTRDF